MRRGSRRRLLIWPFLALCFLLAGRLLLLDRELRPESPLLAGRDDLSISGARSRSPARLVDGRERKAEGSEGQAAYAAGSYMAGRWPGNRTSCAWQHGLPRALSYSDSKLHWSPEKGESSPYRVLPFVVRGSEATATGPLPSITLCTHATAEQVYGIVELTKRWEGPLSLAVFAPGLDAGLAIALLDRACRCEPEMYKVSVHLIFPKEQPPKLRHVGGTRGDCAAKGLRLWGAETERNRAGLTYPINVARNVARTRAGTSRVLVSDIELLPSEKLAGGFVEMVRGRAPSLRVAFVLPVFEVEANQEPPANKRELLLALKAGLAVYFHRFLCPHCQRFPGLARWILRPDPQRVRPLIVTRREYPHHRWEPVFIGTRDDPLYTEDMSWEGRQDKMTQMFEMCLQNYRLVILDGAFLVHTPGIKRKPLKINASRRELVLPHERRNAKIYQRVVKRLLKRYPANRKCSH
ncbi:hypothetical protein KM043_000996 [Ampulex compressa]|nr:hypothetical protein KM043_000996 [Ampulex compressa]